ncbi:MAG: sigma-70 family RNA polymerase sigma factor [Pirellulales bacterium]|nr:sigma-70 family RNA polymerase sigma factor [Pirellulales bacterium]
MALSDLDRKLLDRCLADEPRAWEDFVDRYMGLVIHVINHTSECRSIRLSAEDREDLAADVFAVIVCDDMAVLRNFRGASSLATYLTVIARRIAVPAMMKRKDPARLSEATNETVDESKSAEQRISDAEEVERLLSQLEGIESEVVRMYHLEGMTYQQISSETGLAENSVGPTLSRARDKMRQVHAE